ncbi:hypothetical protein RPE78_09465 [Thioclava litoralis]|uniref:Uncharacterized protein n=1 Tax=Thioclava litoralis TaxID=3076557 RepID=A0ABZ1DYG9_9RHOB|nr:hypothetical protein RPE78_09465 [Thioclava sp. FTW29]
MTIKNDWQWYQSRYEEGSYHGPYPKHLIDDAGMPRLAAHQRLHAPTTQDTSPAEANAKDERAERQRATGHHEDSAPANRVMRKEGNDG